MEKPNRSFRASEGKKVWYVNYRTSFLPGSPKTAEQGYHWPLLTLDHLYGRTDGGTDWPIDRRTHHLTKIRERIFGHNTVLYQKDSSLFLCVFHVFFISLHKFSKILPIGSGSGIDTSFWSPLHSWKYLNPEQRDTNSWLTTRKIRKYIIETIEGPSVHETANVAFVWSLLWINTWRW